MWRSLRITVCLVTFLASLCGAEPPPQRQSATLLPSRTADNPGFQGSAVVRVHPSTVAVAQSFTLECEVQIAGGSATLFNPFLSEEYKLPAQIVITSADGNERHELLQKTEAKSDLTGATTWLPIQPVHSVGRRLTVRVGKASQVRPQRSTERLLVLVPGEYYVQAVYTNWLIADWPNNPSSLVRRVTDGSGDEPQPIATWSAKQMDQPLLVSEPVKLLVLDTAASEKPNATSSKDCSIAAELRPSSLRGRVGEPQEIEIRFINQSDETLQVYNLLLDPWLARWNRAIRLVVLGHDGAEIADLLYTTSGSSRTPQRSDWLRFPPGGTVAKQFRFRAGRVPGSFSTLSPGEYTLQLCIHDYVLSRIPESITTGEGTNHVSFRRWARGFPGKEIGRSSHIAFELLPAAGD